MLKSTLIKLHAAATIFASRNGCAAQEIADIIDVPVNSVYHYAKHHEWHETLDTLGYTGDRNFSKKKTRDPQRDDPNLFALAKSIYRLERTSGRDKKKAVSSICRELPTLTRKRVNRWIDDNNWEAEIQC